MCLYPGVSFTLKPLASRRSVATLCFAFLLLFFILIVRSVLLVDGRFSSSSTHHLLFHCLTHSEKFLILLPFFFLPLPSSSSLAVPFFFFSIKNVPIREDVVISIPVLSPAARVIHQPVRKPLAPASAWVGETHRRTYTRTHTVMRSSLRPVVIWPLVEYLLKDTFICGQPKFSVNS